MEKRYTDKLDQGSGIVYGTRAVIESIRAGKDIDKILVQKGLYNPLIKELIGLAKDHHIPVQQVPVEKLNRVTRKNHQGVIVQLAAVTYSSLENVISSCYSNGRNPFILILDRVTDVRNFGAIVRSAECGGADAIVIPSRGSALINQDAMKTSAGGLNYMPICREDNLKDTLRNLRENGLQIIACSEKTDKMMYEVDLSIPCAVIMGSEEDGISPEYLKLSDEIAKFPINGKISSLNVSVASALVIYEMVRQRI